MARTIRIKLYKFNELNEKAQEKAIEHYRVNYSPDDVTRDYEEMHDSVKAFHDIFGTREGGRSWLDVYCDHISDNVMELKGLRLRTYIINNFWHHLYKGKYYSLWSKTDVTYKHHPEGYPVLKQRHSRVLFVNDGCPLTGICWDNDILQPLFDFIEYKKTPDYYSYMDFETLMNDCIDAARKSIESQEEALYSDEYIREQLQEQDTEYTKYGKPY